MERGILCILFALVITVAAASSKGYQVIRTPPTIHPNRLSVKEDAYRTEINTRHHPSRLPKVIVPSVAADIWSGDVNDEIDLAPPVDFRLSGGNRYDKKVTWSLDQPGRGLPVDVQRQALTNAFKYWSDVADIDIVESPTDLADIHITFNTLDHNDGYPFDGQDGVLAHAFYPRDGRVHFDDDENWTVDTRVGKNLELIATHEFGHVLGLQHSSVWAAVMSPYFQGFSPDFQLHEDDVEAITRLYGKEPTIERAVTNSPNICKMKFDDIVRLPERKYYIFRKKWIYKLNSQGMGVEAGWPRLSNSMYEKFPDSPDAVTYSHSRYRLYAFKGNRVWRYYKNKLDKGFPAKILENSTSIRSAFAWKDGIIYGISSRDIHHFDEDSLSWQWISSLRDIFPDAPYAPEAAVWNSQSSLYLFKKYRFYNINDDTRMTRQGYPQSKHDLWLGCHLRQRYGSA